MSKFDGHVRDVGEIPAELRTALVHKMSDNAHLWLVNDPRFLTAHPDSRHIVFKFPNLYPQTHLSASRTALWDDWAELLTPVIEVVRQSYGFVGCATSKVMLSSLLAHAKVPPHVDSNPSSLVPHKVHVPLTTNPDVTFVIDGERHHLALGRAYEINNLLTHSVENAGDLDRVHFIFEIYPTGVTTSGATR
ncbi:MAG: aspartyl/asparaginyl beta-hydroxylase domain-containing protein [Pseudonocardiaceae bacterium]